jgi:DNA helicase HerA-like ATPase
MADNDSPTGGVAPRIKRAGNPWGAPQPAAGGPPSASRLDANGPTDRILLGRSTKPEHLTLKLANRHGLIAGATGTGKTVTLQVLAEGFSNAGVPVFAADVKGDLSGIAAAGQSKDVFVRRAAEIGMTYTPDSFPVVFWDVFGEQGHPIRATVTEMGPLLLGRLLELNDTQEGVLNIAFRVADDNGWPLVDLKDLRALLQHLAENAAEVARYGNVSKASVGAIQRQLLILENQGADQFMGEPALDLADFIRTDRDGRGIVNILAADKLMARPRLYATFLVWMLSELFEALPEVGDLDRPKLVFFFDEAHLLFSDAPKPLLDAVQQVVRLIRSKGVGVYFVTQNPLDVPEAVLGQLGNKVQHALRAFTPRDQKAVRAAAETFRQNPAFDTGTAILELAVGEALVSTLQPGGVPSVVERALVAPPMARVGPLGPEERRAVMAASPLRGKYDATIDRESAYEMLASRREMASAPAAEAASSGGLGGLLGQLGGVVFGGAAAPAGRGGGRRPPKSLAEQVVTNAANSAARSMGTQIGRAVLRNVLGGLLRGSDLCYPELPGVPRAPHRCERNTPGCSRHKRCFAFGSQRRGARWNLRTEAHVSHGMRRAPGCRRWDTLIMRSTFFALALAATSMVAADFAFAQSRTRPDRGRGIDRPTTATDRRPPAPSGSGIITANTPNSSGNFGGPGTGGGSGGP